MKMNEYQVIVYTTVREIYYVTAASEAEALDTWMDKEPDESECRSVDDVRVNYVDE